MVFWHLAAHEMAKTLLGPERCIALPKSHAFTVCNTVMFLTLVQEDCVGHMDNFDNVMQCLPGLIAATPDVSAIDNEGLAQEVNYGLCP